MDSISSIWGALVIYSLVLFAPVYIPYLDKFLSYIFGGIVLLPVLDEDPVEQSTWARAWTDTRHAIHQVWFWFIEITMVPLAVGIMLTWTPESLGTFWYNLFGAGVAIIMVIVVVGVAFLFNVLAATARQRNEARNLIREIRSGYFTITTGTLHHSVAHQSRINAKTEASGVITGLSVVVTNTSDSVAVSLHSVGMVKMKGDDLVALPNKIEFDNVPSWIDEERLLQGSPLVDGVYIQPHQTIVGVVNFAERSRKEFDKTYLFASDSFSNDYQLELFGNVLRSRATVITEFPWKNSTQKLVHTKPAEEPEPTQ